LEAVQEIGKIRGKSPASFWWRSGYCFGNFQPGLGWLGHLPGDISIEKGNFRFYFPLATLRSHQHVLTLGGWILRR